MAILTGCHSSGVASFACAQAGCPECLEALIRKHERLVQYIVWQVGKGVIEGADLMQEGRIGLWQAIQHYDPERGRSFGGYAWVAIEWRLWAATENSDQEQNDEAEAWLEMVDEIEEEWWRGQVRQALLEAVRKLPARLERLIRLEYGLDGQGWHSLAAIGRLWGISRERVRQLHKDALVRLMLPAWSMRLRSLCEQDNRQAYLQARSMNRTWQRSQRRRR
jgi:RNA polymerase sigma factor (sigma-70 family)